MFDFKGENMKLLEGLQKDDVVTITFDVNGYKYKDEQGHTKVFTSIRPYQLMKREKKQEAAPVQNQQPAVQTQVNDDLPF